MTPIFLLRHGPTDWNAEGRVQGRHDPALSAEGVRSVQSWRLPALPQPLAVHVSPLRRAVETAALLGLAGRTEPRLVEMAWGSWEGARLEDLRAADPAGMAALEAQGLDLRAPGGESPREVQQRLLPFFAELAARGTPALLVAHNGVMRAALSLATGWDMRAKPPLKLRRGALLALELEAGGRPGPQARLLEG